MNSVDPYTGCVVQLRIETLAPTIPSLLGHTVLSCRASSYSRKYTGTFFLGVFSMSPAKPSLDSSCEVPARTILQVATPPNSLSLVLL